MFFKGTISLICDPKIVCDIMMNVQTVKVITLDEDNAVPMLCDENNPQLVTGTILLPPVEALWAETDGNKELFASIYYSYLLQPECMEYIAALIAAMYQGVNLILYFPDQESIIIKFLYDFFIKSYGIIISTNINQPFQYDERSIPAYCNAIINVGAMSIREYLYWYPLDAVIPDNIYTLIAEVLKIPGNMVEQRELITAFHKAIKKNQQVIIPIHSA